MIPPCLARAAVVVAALVVPALTATAAQAAWPGGDAPSGPVVAHVTAVPAGTGVLYPGAAASLSFRVTNPGDASVTFTQVSFAGVESDDPVACPARYVTVVPSATVTVRVGGSATSSAAVVPAAIAMHADAPDGCQGRTFSITTTLTTA